MTPLEQELLTILNQIPAAIEKAFTNALVLRHPGHGNQKVHGNRFGTGQAKESLRRLKDDKGAREKYKAAARGRGRGSGATGGTTKPVEVDKRDLSTRTKQQRKKDIEHLSKLPLKDIRRRQDLVKSQQESAYSQWKNSNDPVTRERLERASSNLAQMDDDLMAAAGKWLDRDDKRKKVNT